MNDLPRLVKPEDILRGKVFNVALPFTNGRPLNFVFKDESQKDVFKIVRLDDGLEGKIGNDGNRKAEILKIVTEIKMRPALIIDKDEFNHNPNYPFVVILPIATLSKSQKEKSIFKRMIRHNDIERFYYLGNGSYITVNDPQRVYKNMIFENESDIVFGESTMIEIFKRFAQCFAIDRIIECDRCEHNCENCNYKKIAVNN